MVTWDFVTVMLFSGYLVDLRSIVVCLRWIQWISVFRYASNVLAINEFRNLTLFVSMNSEMGSMKGEDILLRRHIRFTTI